MLKTEEHTVQALESMYKLAAGVSLLFVVALGAFGIKSVSDFNKKLDQSRADYDKIKSDSKSACENQAKELEEFKQQRIVAQKEYDARLASFEVEYQKKIKEVENILDKINEKIIDATELSQAVEIIDREMTKIRSLEQSQQTSAAQLAKVKIVPSIKDARKYAGELDHTKLQSWTAAQEGRLHLWLKEWDDAAKAMKEAEQLDVKRFPDRAYNLACLYAKWFEADSTASTARQDVEALRWANEAVNRAITSPQPSRDRGFWLNLLETDLDLDVLRAKYPEHFNGMRERLISAPSSTGD
jgi:DNA repair exonuclease SbcCD ATPase subunit